MYDKEEFRASSYLYMLVDCDLTSYTVQRINAYMRWPAARTF